MGYTPGRSDRLTMGTVLDIASNAGAPVSIMAGNQWISGRMGKRDDQGVSVLVRASGEPGEHYDAWVVVKFDQVQAVRIPADLEERVAIDAAV